VDLQFRSRQPVAASIGSAGLLAGCRVDLPVHDALYTNRQYRQFVLKIYVDRYISQIYLEAT
jgi:hypothetical protein